MTPRTLLHRLRLLLTRAGSERSRTRLRWHSVSSCREYDLCPRRYRYAYIERRTQDRPAPAGWRYGTVVHAALEAAYRARKAGASTHESEAEAITALHHAWDDEHLPTDDGWPQRSEQLVRRTLALDLVNANDILGIEHRFGAPFDSTTAFAGYADLILRRDDHTIEIVDHKVTRNVAAPETLQHDLQLNLYGWLAKQEWPWAQTIIATHHYPPAATTTTVELTDTSIDDVMRSLVATARRATADTDYTPTPGEHCSHCSWAYTCPAVADTNHDPSQGDEDVPASVTR